MNQMSWPKRWPTWKDLWRTLMPSLQHDHLHQDMTPNRITSLGTQPWNARNCTENKKYRKRGTAHWEHSQKANEPTGAFVLQLEERWPFLSSSCNEVIARLNSIYLLRPCRMGCIRLKSSIQTKGKKKWTSHFFFWSGFVSVVWLPCLFSVGHSHLCTILCFYFIFFFIKRKKN